MPASYISALTSGAGITIDGLFGEYCSGNTFDHDKHMSEMTAALKVEEQHESQATTESHRHSSPVLGRSSPIPSNDAEQVRGHPRSNCYSQATIVSPYNDGGRSVHNNIAGERRQVIDFTLEGSDASHGTVSTPMISTKRNFEDFSEDDYPLIGGSLETAGTKEEVAVGDLFDSQESSISDLALETRRAAFEAVLQSSSPAPWNGLLSTTNNHSHLEDELGED